MMEEMNKWLSAHKKLCVITGIFGLLVSPFLWPIFLAVIMDCRKPVYTLYIDKKNDVFKGYDYRTKKWSDSMLDKTCLLYTSD